MHVSVFNSSGIGGSSSSWFAQLNIHSGKAGEAMWISKKSEQNKISGDAKEKSTFFPECSLHII